MSETSVPYLAPGCYGSALLFQSDSMSCGACPFKEQCEPVHDQALAAMRERLGIKVPAKKTPLAPVLHDAPEDPSRMTLPKKVRELLRRLDAEDFDICGKIKAGINPFAGHDRYRYMMIACHLVMRLNVPVTQKVIAAGLARTMGWAEGTADAHARMAMQALTHVGAIDNQDGIFVVRNSK